MKNNLIGIMFALLTIVTTWITFYFGHVLKIGDGSWYDLPYIITSLCIFILFLGVSIHIFIFKPFK